MRHSLSTGLLLLLCSDVLWAADPPKCLSRYTTELFELGDWELRRRVLAPVGTYGRNARRGVELMLEYRAQYLDGLERFGNFLEYFRYKPVPMLYRSDAEVLEGLHRIHSRTPQGIPHFSHVMADLGNRGSRSLAQGAAFEVYAADRTALGVRRWRSDIAQGGAQYNADWEDVNGFRNEAKGHFGIYDTTDLSTPRISADGLSFEYLDLRLSDLSELASRVLLVERADGFHRFRLHLPASKEGERSVIEAVVTKALESNRVTSNLNPTQIIVVRADLLRAMPDLLVFHD